MSRTAVTITLDTSEQELLQKIHRRRNLPEYQKERIQIVLVAANGLQNRDIAAQYNLEVHRIGVWRKRWATQHQDWKNADESLRPPMAFIRFLLMRRRAFKHWSERHRRSRWSRARWSVLSTSMSGMVRRICLATRIRFVYTPKHCSWLNQIENGFSGLSCRVLRRGNFDSVDALNEKILNYIEFYNQTATPMKWKCKRLPKNIVMNTI